MKRSAADIAEEVYLTPISEEEFERRLAARRTPEDDEERRRLIAWFSRRYPTPLERLRYVTRRVRGLRSES